MNGLSSPRHSPVAAQQGPGSPSDGGAGRRAVVLLSGGLDSATVAALARGQGFAVYALTVDYGQRHVCEIDAARRVAASVGAEEHVVLRVDLRPFGGSALTGEIPVPRHRTIEEISTGIPVTYVPARNTILLALALAWAEALEARDLFVGVNAVDYSGYPDCRPEFLRAFEALAQTATKAGVEGAAWRIHAPLIQLTKGEIIQRGVALGVDYGLTSSCYSPDEAGRPCGSCDSCLLRAKGFAEAGVPDPLLTRF